jgi:hypothetical protein
MALEKIQSSCEGKVFCRVLFPVSFTSEGRANITKSFWPETIGNFGDIGTFGDMVTKINYFVQ